MAIYRGLNTSLGLNDIDDKDEALLNLGLDRRDLDVISGLSGALGGGRDDEFRLISGLDLDQKKELYAVSRSGATLEGILTGLTDIQQSLKFSLNIDSQLRAGAIKYTYLDFVNPTGPVKSADISTSRVSSWSSTDEVVTLTSPIFYGGDLEIIGDANGANTQITEFELIDEPVLTQFDAEEATHLVSININGTAHQFYAMKGIPLQYEAFFRNINLDSSVTVGATTPAWKIINLDNNREFSREATSYNFRDNRSRPRLVEYYQNPKNILSLEITSANLIELPAVTLPEITKYNLQYNDFYEMPDFESLAPKLEELYMRGNNLTRARDANDNLVVANTQLDKVGASGSPLRILQIRGCFADTTNIDLSKYTSLTDLDFDAYYSSYRARQMNSTVSPEVANSIVNYNIGHQSFAKLAYSVTQATNLARLNIYWNGLNAARNASNVDVDVTLASNNLLTFNSQGNPHNVVDVSGKTSLTYYAHRYSRGLRGAGTSSANIAGKFVGCSSLGTINFYATNVEGSIGTNFQNLSSLSTVDIRWSRMSGGFDDNTFDNTPNLGYWYMAGSNHSGVMFPPSPVDSGRSRVFHNTPNLRRFYLYSNGSVSGELPDFSKNTRLNVLYIVNTGLSGAVTNFSENTSLWGLYIINNQFSGSAPGLNHSGFYNAYFYGNQFEGQIPTVVGASNLRRWYLHRNKLSGNVPDLSGAPRLEYFLAQDQRPDGNGNTGLTGYTPGAIATNTRLRRFDLTNNNLGIQAARDIIADAFTNYQANRRRGVNISLQGNPNITESAVTSVESVAETLQFLRDSGWTILI